MTILFTFFYILILSFIKLLFQKNKAESETVNESSWRDSEKVWLVHQGGYSAGLLYKQKNADGETYSCKVKLDHGGEVVEVEEDAVEKVNIVLFLSEKQIEVF